MITELMSGLTVAVPVVAAVVAGVLARGYVKAPPDKALIISGVRKKPKVLIGKAGVKIPFFERVDELSLKLIPLDIRTGDAVPTADCINIYVDSAVNVKIGSTPEMVEVAAKNFLNKTSEEVGAIVAEVLEGNIREILNTDTAVRGCGLREGNLHAGIAGVADFCAGRTGIARVVEEQGQVDFCRGGKGDAAQDIQKTGLKVVASIHSLVTPFRCSDRDVLNVARRDVAQDDHARRFRGAMIRDLVAPVLKRCGDRRAVREWLGDEVKLEFAARFEVVVLNLGRVIELGDIILVRLVPKAEPSLLAEGVDDLAKLSFCDLACQRAGHAQGALFPVFRAEVVSARAARNGDLTSSLWRKQVVVSNHHQTPVVYAVISAEAKAIAGHVGASPLLRISRAVSAPICLPTRRASSSEPSPL